MRWKATTLSKLMVVLSLTFALSLAAQSNSTIQYFYDDLGRLTAVVDPSGNVASYAYDAAGNLLSITRSQVSPGALAIFNFIPQQGLPGTTVTIQGQGFSATSADDTLKFNGTPATVTSATSTQIVATVPLGAATGPISVTVGGVTAQGGSFTVLAPIIASLSPPSAFADGPAFALTVNGSNFNTGSVVRWNGSNRPTGFQSSSVLTASISASDLTAAGIVQVTVLTSGVTSNAATFTVNNVPPAITLLSPSGATAGGGAFTLMVFGSNFLSTSVVQWNGSSRSTVFGGSAQLSASISSSDIASVGSAQVTVFSPGPVGEISNSVTFRTVGATGPVGVVGAMDLANDGTPGFCSAILPATSRDGRFVAFDSCGALVPEDTNATDDIYLRDNCQGAPAGCTPSTMLISTAIDGSASNQGSTSASVSADGRFVAFSSSSTNLVPNDTNGASDVFLRDTCTGAPAGCTPSTTVVSVASGGSQGNGFSGGPSMSADGRFVAFSSDSTNLVPNDTNGKLDVFVRDTCFGTSSGCVPSTIRVSVANDGSEGNGLGEEASVSADGRFVVFVSSSTNLVAGSTSNDFFGETYVRDTCLGATGCTPSTILVSVASDGTHSAGAGFGSAISAGGRFVTFNASFPNFLDGQQYVFVRDTCVGATGCTPSTILASVASDGTTMMGNTTTGSPPTSSADGRFVALDANPAIFVRDTCLGAVSGCVPSTVLVSVAADGTPADGNSAGPAISADGRFVAFYSSAHNLGIVGIPGINVFHIYLALTGF